MNQLSNGPASQHGNGSVPKGGILLGTREMRVNLSRENTEKLKVLAHAHGTTIHTMLEFIADQGINVGWNQFLAGRMFYVLGNWITWAV